VQLFDLIKLCQPSEHFQKTLDPCPVKSLLFRVIAQ
jgi:hypothetical protein